MPVDIAPGVCPYGSHFRIGDSQIRFNDDALIGRNAQVIRNCYQLAVRVLI